LIEIYNGDCRHEIKKIKPGTVDLILTDLPYGTAKGMRSSPASLTTGLSANEWDDAIDPVEVFEMADHLLRPKGRAIFFSQEPYTSKLITNAPNKISFKYRMIWLKNHFANCLLAKKAPVNYYEDIIVFGKNGNEEHQSIFNLWEGKAFKSNVLEYSKDLDGYHPTQKPQKLLIDLINTFSNKGDLVVDFTMGSGSTGVACKTCDRSFIGIEMDKKYFETAKSRLKQSTLNFIL